MHCDYVNLDKLATYIRRFPTIPYKSHVPDVFRPFQSIYRELLAGIPDVTSWYVWINRLASSDNPIVYIGQSQTGKTSSLKARINEELLDEHVALWATVHGSEHVFQILDTKSEHKYSSDIRRSLRKAGTTDIVWLAQTLLTDDQLDYVEHMLIKILKPIANKRRPKFRREYPDLLEDVSILLREKVKQAINAKGS